MYKNHSARVVDRERIFLRVLLELYQDMPLLIPTKESKDIESYRRLEEVRRYSNKELKVSRESIEKVRDTKDYATLGKHKSFQYVYGMPGIAYNPFMVEEAMEAYFDYEQVIILDFWVERVEDTGMLMVEQPNWESFWRNEWLNPRFPSLRGN